MKTDVISCVHTVVGESTATRTVPIRLTKRCLFHTHIRRLCVSPLHGNMHNLSRRSQPLEITAHPWTFPFISSKYLPLPSISCLVVKLPPPPPVALSEAKPSRRKLAQPVDCSPWPCPHNKLNSTQFPTAVSNSSLCWQRQHFAPEKTATFVVTIRSYVPSARTGTAAVCAGVRPAPRRKKGPPPCFTIELCYIMSHRYLVPVLVNTISARLCKSRQTNLYRRRSEGRFVRKQATPVPARAIE